MNEPIHELEAYFVGTATDDQLRTVEAWLHADPDNAKAFMEQLYFREVLGQRLRERGSASTTADALAELARLHDEGLKQSVRLRMRRKKQHEETHGPSSGVARRLPPRVIAMGSIAAAIAIAGLTVLVLNLLSSPEQPIAEQQEDAITVATLTAERDAQWSDTPAERALARGSQLYPGDTLTLTEGFAEITTARGAIAILEAPATIEFTHNDNAIRLHTGKLVGVCETDTSKGFLVRTPHMDVTDLGTRFGVDATDTRTTEVHVFDGEVAVALADAGDADEPTLLTAGESASTSSFADAVVKIEQQTEAFAELIPATVELPGTGIGFGIGQTDPNWAIIEMDGRTLDRPRPVSVLDPELHKNKWFQPPATGTSLMVGFDIKDRPVTKQPYVFQTRFEIPNSMNPAATELHLRYMADIYLEWVRINGQRIRLDQPALGWGQFKQSGISQHLKAGQNTIALEVLGTPPETEKTDQPGYLGLRLEWELKSIASSIPKTTTP